MFIILGILLWLVIGFCAYILEAKRLHITRFDWVEFLCNICFGLISFIIYMYNKIKDDFPKLIEKFLKKLNK